jgi:predicted N-acetyltransferase YhbS
VAATIDWLRAEELPAMQAYIAEHWEQDHVLARDATLLRWQYRHPDPELLSVLAARDGARIVGILGLIRAPFVWCGRRFSAAWLAMWSAAPEQRRRGLGLALLVDAMERFDVIACVGFNDAAARIYRALGFDVRPSLPRWVAAVDPAAYEQLVGAKPATVAAPEHHAAVAHEWEQTTAGRWDAAWDEYAARVVGTARDAAFIRWRYLEHPTFQYVVHVSADGRALCVARFEQVRDSTAHVLRIVELLGDETRAAELAASAVAKAPTGALADFFCASAEFGAPLERLGFARVDDRSAVPDRFQPLERSHGLNAAFWRRDGGGAAFDGVRLYATRADGDQDRPR